MRWGGLSRWLCRKADCEAEIFTHYEKCKKSAPSVHSE